MKMMFSLIVVAVAATAMADVNFGNDHKAWTNFGRYSGSSGQTYQRHAYDHSRVLNNYSSTGQPVPKEIVQEHATEIRHNVAASTKAYGRLSEEAKKDPAAAKSMAAIESSLAKTLAMCDMLDAECAKAEGDSATICKCCADMEKELKAADAAHEKLMKQMKLDEPRVATKQ